MTIRQKILKLVYPLWMWWRRIRGKNITHLSGNQEPPVSFYSLKATRNDGTELDFASLRGKKIMIVNTASDCGYTRQYEALEELYEMNRDKLLILAFPANDFKQQEKGSDAEIAEFCRSNFGIQFPVMQKTVVRKKDKQHPVYEWLSNPARNGWNDRAPSWNFSKYIIDEEGRLLHYFGPAVSPRHPQILEAIK
jgi:glutathione peroxidase